MISIITTVHNEGPELTQTLESIAAATTIEHEVIVVDDGSTDGSCSPLNGDVQVIRHERRRGVAHARNAGVSAARGDVLGFLDGHQRLSAGCFDQCAEFANARNAIVSPDICGFDVGSPLTHGAQFAVHPERKDFTARWLMRPGWSNPSRISSLRAPGYVMPRSVYEQVRWIDGMRGWGGSEAAVSLKAFFLGIPLLHLCGPLTRHRFKKEFHYDVSNDEPLWNNAVIARVCFDERTWNEYWLPHVFGPRLTSDMAREIDSEIYRDQQRDFQRRKTRSDRDFWHCLLNLPLPPSLRSASTRVAGREFRLPLRNRR